MGRKKGGKNSTTELKGQIIAEKVINQGRTLKSIAEEMGIDRNTVSSLMNKAMSDSEVRSRVQRSRDRVVKMLGYCDQTYLDVFQNRHPDHFGDRLKAAQSIYRTMGVLQDEPAIRIQQITPIRVEIGEKTYTIGHDQVPSETGPSVRDEE